MDTGRGWSRRSERGGKEVKGKLGERKRELGGKKETRKRRR